MTEVAKDLTEFNKMKNGGWYDVADPEIARIMNEASQLSFKYNYGDQNMDPETIKEKLFGRANKTNLVFTPIRMGFGVNTFLGDGAMINYDCDFMDHGTIKIGSRTLVGPRCQFITVYHPLHAESRLLGKMFTKPITIGADCWIGAGATIMGGVTLENKTIVAAGAVVTHSFPDGSVIVGGNPARVIRQTDDAHSDIPDNEFKARRLITNIDTKQLHVGDTEQVAAMTLPPNTRGGHYSFSSSNDSIITISHEGKITAVGNGETTITVLFIQPEFDQVISQDIRITVI